MLPRYLIISIITLFTSGLVAQQGDIQISGRITDDGNPMEGVSVGIAETDIGVASDDSGYYEIIASKGDILVFSHLGMETVEIIVEDVTRVLNIEMEPRFEELDEVVVKRRKRSQKALEEQYPTNKNLIRTGFGIMDYESSGFKIKVFAGDDLSRAGLDFLGALQSKVPGLRIFRPPNDPTRPVVFLPRRFNSLQTQIPAAYELDGVVYTEAPTFIQVENIERIAVINTAGALTRYGSLAAGGLIIINTKQGNFFSKEPGEDKPFDTVKLRDNIFYAEDLAVNTRSPMPRELEVLHQSASYEEAVRYVEQNGLLAHPSAYFKIRTGRYFYEVWKERDYYIAILEKVMEQHDKNPVALKAVAYSLEEVGAREKALSAYLQIFKLRPGYGQSYRDLANSYAENRDTIKAVKLLSRFINYKQLNTKPADGGIDSIISTDFSNLINQQTRRITSDMAGDRLGTRIIIEWNNGDAEFELQFVNPENHYYKWNHSYRENYELVKKEKLEGYSSEQFFIDDQMPGKWRVNLKYLGNKSFDPTFLKATVYYHYGLPYERHKSFYFQLTEKNLNRSLFTLINNPIASAGKP